MENVLSKKVWLKAGAYLVIDYTEAMTIIDVNTGKNEAKTELGDTIKRVNLEAVSEIASLLRLRNISGIIIIDFIDMIVKECGKQKHEYTSCSIPEEFFEAIKNIVSPQDMEEAVFTDEKQIREANIKSLKAKLEESFADNEEWLALLDEAIYQYQKKTVRKMILKDKKRPDGRAMTQIRKLSVHIIIKRHWMNFVETIINISFFLLHVEKFSI